LPQNALPPENFAGREAETAEKEKPPKKSGVFLLTTFLMRTSLGAIYYMSKKPKTALVLWGTKRKER